MKRTPKTYSVAEVVRRTGFSRAWISRLCQHGEIGVRVDIPEAGFSVFRISAKEISALKQRKTQGFKKSTESD